MIWGVFPYFWFNTYIIPPFQKTKKKHPGIGRNFQWHHDPSGAPANLPHRRNRSPPYPPASVKTAINHSHHGYLESHQRRNPSGTAEPYIHTPRVTSVEAITKVLLKQPHLVVSLQEIFWFWGYPFLDIPSRRQYFKCHLSSCFNSIPGPIPHPSVPIPVLVPVLCAALKA